MRDIAAARRTKILSVNVKVITVPNFEGLTIKTMLEFVKDREDVQMSLPAAPREIEKLPRQYIANVIHTLVGKPFESWVNQQVEIRNDKITIEKDQVEMDPEIAAIYLASTSVSGTLIIS